MRKSFGFIFIVCATGKSSDELLLNLRKRLGNPGEKELHIAAAEQARINHAETREVAKPMSTISTHILDIARGGPANGRPRQTRLSKFGRELVQLAEAWTDDDGRVKPFFLVGAVLSAGNYRLVFDTEAYFSAYDIDCFYPQVCVSFKIGDSPQHYHVPLLLSPLWLSTYRGS